MVLVEMPYKRFYKERKKPQSEIMAEIECSNKKYNLSLAFMILYYYICVGFYKL